MQDKQLAAIQAIVATLADLEDSDRQMALAYINMRFGGAGTSSFQQRFRVETPSDAAALPPDQAASFAELYNSFHPQTEAERALVAGYWSQVVQGRDTFDSLSINRMLKDMGYGVSNITRSLDQLMNSEPRLVVQVRKSGSSRQARKLYRLTQAGIQKVRDAARPDR